MEEAPSSGEESSLWRMCRTCMTLANESNSMCDLFDAGAEPQSLAEMVAACTGLQVHKEDGLPELLCDSCVKCVSSFYEFRSTAERVDEALRKLVQPKNSVKQEAKVKQEMVDEFPILDDATQPTSDSEEDKPLITYDRVKKHECAECGKTYEKISKLERHMSIHNKKGPKIKIEVKDEKTRQRYTACCTICGKTFDKPSKLERHEKIHRREPKAKVEPRECSYCSKTFKKECHLQRHMAIHDPNSRPFQCEHCQRRFRFESKYLLHLVSHQGPNGNVSSGDRKPDCVKLELEIDGTNTSMNGECYPCTHCSQTFQSSHSLAAHMRKHGYVRKKACDICGKQFNKTSHLKRHESTHEDKRPFKCQQCPKSFATETLLFEHSNKHKGLKPHSCPVCGKAFAQRGTLNAHLRVHTRERPYLCPTCGKRFDSSTNLKQHIRRHTGEKSFSCTLCPDKFVSKGELKSHMSTHTGARPFVCDSCGSSFTKPNSLRKHKLRHLGIKPHECDVCFMKFTGKEHLKRHYRIHTGEKPYKCDLCERAFTQSNDLVKHKRAHLGENLYKCTECSQSFRLKTELRNHISEHFVSSQVAAGIPVTIPPDILPPLTVAEKNVHKDAPDSKQGVVVTQANDVTLLTVEKGANLTHLSQFSEKLLAEHVKNIPTAITVKRITSMT